MNESITREQVVVALDVGLTNYLNGEMAQRGLARLHWHIKEYTSLSVRVAGQVDPGDYSHKDAAAIVHEYAAAFGGSEPVRKEPSKILQDDIATLETTFTLDERVTVTVWGVVERVEESVR